MSRDIVVVGAGVIGLSSALALSEEGYQVKIIAKHLPTDPLNSQYTSQWAGAHFRPFPSKSDKDHEESKLTRKTLKRFRKLAIEEPWSSVKFIKGIDYLEDKGIYDVKSKGYHEDIADLKEISKADLPKGVKFGAEYETWVVNPPIYIQYLQRKLIFKYGVQFERREIVSLKEVSELNPGSIIINATGLGLQFNGGLDPKSFVIRGQTLLVRAPEGHPYENQTITHQASDGLWTFIISRPLEGGVIIGGTKQVDDYQSSPKIEDTEAITKRAKVLFPEVFINGKLDIRTINVGFRPARKGGIRIEPEQIEGQQIVHAYGFGGMGYETSWGAAEEVLKHVKSLSRSSRL